MFHAFFMVRVRSNYDPSGYDQDNQAAMVDLAAFSTDSPVYLEITCFAYAMIAHLTGPPDIVTLVSDRWSCSNDGVTFEVSMLAICNTHTLF